MANFPQVSSFFTMKFRGFTETFKTVLFASKRSHQHKDKNKDKKKDKDNPAARVPAEPKHYQEESNLKACIIQVDSLLPLVGLPLCIDRNEWLATHATSFFNNINELYAVMSCSYCTPDACPTMLGPDNVQYNLVDRRGKKMKRSAPYYIDFALSYVARTVTDQAIFPTELNFGKSFPPDFQDAVRKIHRYLFHVLAHIYHSHYYTVVDLDLHGHLNTVFTHFMAFSSHFQLLSDKEVEGLKDLYEDLLLTATLDSAAADQSPEASPCSDHTDKYLDSLFVPHQEQKPQLPQSEQKSATESCPGELGAVGGEPSAESEMTHL